MKLDFGFDRTVRGIEAALVRDLELTRVALPRELARLEGRYRDADALLEARAYRGPRVRWARFVELCSEHLQIGNALCLPRLEYSTPILGVDLVSVGRDTAVVVGDLSPLVRSETDPLPGVSREDPRRSALSALPQAGPLPEWARAWFSERALFARVMPPEAHVASRAVAELANDFTDLMQSARPNLQRTAFVAERQLAYCAAHREHDRGLLLLQRFFQPSLAERFLREVLFPERVFE